MVGHRLTSMKVRMPSHKHPHITCDESGIKSLDATTLTRTQRLHGVKRVPHKTKKEEVIPLVKSKGLGETIIPDSFDWRTYGSGSLLTPVLDQEDCGCCYAFSSTSMLADRISIATNGSVKELLSPQDIANCGNKFVTDKLSANDSEINQLITQGTLLDADYYALEGCEGGTMAAVANYLVYNGVPLASDVPFTCPTGKSSCINTKYCTTNSFGRIRGTKAVYVTDGKEDYNSTELDQTQIDDNCKNMQLAIMTQGPIAAAMDVYLDFEYYTPGTIYIKVDNVIMNGRQQVNTFQGGHAISIVGWGKTTPTDGSEPVLYWIIRNSWGPAWGDNGYFYLQRGVNMVNIETDCVAVLVDTSNLSGSTNVTNDSTTTTVSYQTPTVQSGPVILKQGISDTSFIVITIVVAVIALALAAGAIFVATKLSKKKKNRLTQ
jgi:C1A family cysteine protease